MRGQDFGSFSNIKINLCTSKQIKFGIITYFIKYFKIEFRTILLQQFDYFCSKNSEVILTII